ncbi:geranylgeranylglyceryl/heptaprenylglyceryl phosphate synthase [Flavobacterium terrigena]|uniref:Geranylgeranylglyceryl phosphate synthase n=1 Tax=Flavobacterium terrigena TaxID=402734 RepID=A0A1H6SJ68_9FLAO|nr:geranylgeranylglyceryl/heptaprenylglyceryl phosphate synthase [Flavobacterium terrigena]SEI67881.1 putative glycerol-1-phosphate prenyltransferase [Flavobacterium terrigena]
MKNIYQNILVAKQVNEKLLAILIDPDKTKVEEIENISQKINQSPATHIFIGGSIVEQICIDSLIIEIKKHCHLPILIFPGHPSQISNEADGILFLSLLSGRNPDYLIEHHINSVDILTNSTLEIISTGYILIDGGNETAVQRVSQTLPIENTNIELAYKTAKAGEYLGKKLIYLEAGSGANHHVSLEMVAFVSKNISIPLIVGGGIRNLSKIEEIFKAGADIVVIGTAFENDSNFFNN